MATEEELMARKHRENEECLDRLQDIVQEKIVPLDPIHVMGKLGTIDKAVAYYIEIAEQRNKTLTELVTKLEKQKEYVHGCIDHPNCKDINDYYSGSDTAYGFCIDELRRIISKK